MHRCGLIILAFWPAISVAQNTFSLKNPDRAFFQSRELFFKEKYLQSIQKWEDVQQQPTSILDENEEYLSWIARQNLLRDHSNPALEEFFEKESTHPKKSIAYFLMGSEEYRKKNYPAVLKYFDEVEVSQLTPIQVGEYYFKSGYSLMMGKYVQESLDQFKKVKGQTSGYGPAASYYSGYLGYLLGNYSEAKKDLLSASGDPDFSKTVNDLLAMIYYKEGDTEKLIQFAEELEERGGRGAHIKNLDLLVGDAYFSRGDFSRAWEYFSKSEPGNPGTLQAELAYRYGRSLFEIEDYSKAKNYLKIGVSKSKNDTLTQFCAYYAAVNYVHLEDYVSATLFFDKASELGVSRSLKENASLNRAKIRIMNGFVSQSIDILIAYKDEFPQGSYRDEVNILLAEAYLKSNRYLDGIMHLEASNTWDLKNRKAYQKLCFHHASHHFNDRTFDSALYYFDKSQKYPEDNDLSISANFWKGEASSIKRNWNNAILNYGRVFQQDKSGSTSFYYPSRYGIAFAYFKSRQYEKALGHYSAFVNYYETKRKGKNYEDALLRKADCHFVLRQYSQANPVYQKIYNRGYKGRDYAAFRLGEIAWIQNKGKEAKKYFGKILEQYPQSPYLDDAIFEKATVSFEIGEYTEAIRGFDVLIRDHPMSPLIPQSYFKKGMANMGNKEPDKAIREFRIFLSRFPRHKKAVEVLSSLQEALIEAGRAGEFDSDKIAFQKANPESKALESIEFENGKEFYLAGEHVKSLPLISKFLQDYPSSSYRLEAVNMLAVGYDDAGKLDSAFKYYSLVKSFGNSEYLKRSLERCALISQDRLDFQTSLGYFQGWFSMSSSPEEQILVEKGLLMSYFQLEMYDSSLSLSQRISELESPFGNRNMALLYWGKSLLQQGKLDEAKERFQITIEEASDENAAEAKFLIASIHFRLAEFRESIEVSLELISSFSHYSYWNDQAFLLISDNFLGLDDLFQARATLESIIENSPDPETVSKAREKLQVVGEKEELLNEMVDTIE